MKTLLEVQDLEVWKQDVQVIDHLSFSLHENSINAILCPNQGGKTTLIETLSGIVTKKKGMITCHDIPLTFQNFRTYQLQVGVVLADFDSPFLENTVQEELSFPLINLGFRKKEIKKRIDLVSRLFQIEKILSRKIEDISRYEKVKVMIAASFVHFPKLLLLDDIFLFLSPREKKDLRAILMNISKQYSLSILFTTSDVSDVVDLENIFVLSSGSIVMQGDFASIIQEDNMLTKMGFAIPIMIDLSRKLEFYHLIDHICYDVDEVVNELWKSC